MNRQARNAVQDGICQRWENHERLKIYFKDMKGDEKNERNGREMADAEKNSVMLTKYYADKAEKQMNVGESNKA